MVSLVGMAKRGKSTLINVLLGRNDTCLAPVDKLPATSVATIYRWAEDESVIVTFQDGATKSVSQQEIKDYVTEEGNPRNGRAVRHVIVSGPFSDVLRRISLVDLPGMGSMNALHSQVLFEFLPQCDAVLFVTTARMPMNAEEVELLRAVQQKDIHKIFVAINKTDITSPDDLVDCENHNRSQLALTGVSVLKIHKFSARRALEGDMEGSGVAEFLKDLSDFLVRKSESILANKLKTEVLCAASITLEGMAARIAAFGKSKAEIDRERDDLAKMHHQALQDVELNEKSFNQTWDQAVNEAEVALVSAKDRVAIRMGQYVERASFLELNSFAKVFSVKFNEVLDEEAGPALRKMEAKLQSLCDELQVTYPSIGLGMNGAPRIGRGHSTKGFLVSSALQFVAGMGQVGSATLAAAAASTMVVTPAATIAASIASTFSGGLAAFISALGTTAVGAAGSSALLVAAGPLGLALAGIGALVIPLSWRISLKLKRDEISEEVERHVDMVFRTLSEDRLPAFHKFRSSIVSELRTNLDRRVGAIREALGRASARASGHKDDPAEFQRYEDLRQRLSNPPATI